MENYGEFAKIIEDVLNNAVKKRALDIRYFIERIEEGFTRFGFRGERQNSAVKNILIIRLDAVGDFVLTSATIRTIRENYPQAHITLVVSKTLYPLAELCPYVNEVFAIEQDVEFSLRMVADVAEFSIKYLWRRHFDLGFYLGVVVRPIKNFLLYMSGAKERICFETSNLDRYFATKSVEMNFDYYDHDCVTNLRLLEQAGLKINSTDLEVWYDYADLIQAQSLIENFAVGRKKISVGIGARKGARRYPVEKYLVAFKEIIEKGGSVIIFGGKNELDDAKFLEENLPADCVKNLVPVQTGWRIDTAIVSLTDMYIGNMTGLCDIAATLKKPVITLSRVAKDTQERFKDNEAWSYRPYRTKFIMLCPQHQLEECAENPIWYGCRAENPHCITQIAPSAIVKAYEEILR